MAKYPISSYNKYVCLKANDLMIIISLYLLKPFIVAIASITYRKDRSAIINMIYPEKIFISFEAAATIPLLFLIYAWTRRAPGASQLTKKIWSNGKKLIIMTAFLQLSATSILTFLWTDSKLTYISWIQIILYLAVIAATYVSRYMTDCFCDFPVDGEKQT